MKTMLLGEVSNIKILRLIPFNCCIVLLKTPQQWFTRKRSSDHPTITKYTFGTRNNFAVHNI